MFAPCDFAPGDEIFVECGAEFPFESPYRRPWKLLANPDDDTQFEKMMQILSGKILEVKHSVIEVWDQTGGTLSAMDYPEDLESCFNREINGCLYSVDSISEALLGWILRLGNGSLQIPEKLESYGRQSAKLVQRFLEDSISYLKIDDNSTEPVTLFGLMIGLVNHACFPNAVLTVRRLRNLDDGTIPQPAILSLVACHAIKEGEEITFSYTGNVPAGVREQRAELLEMYNFDCRCHACIGEADALFLVQARDALNQLLRDFNQLQEENAELPLKVYFNMARWIIDASEELGYFDMELLHALRICYTQSEAVGDHLRASYFFRAIIEMIRTYMPGSGRLREAEDYFEKICKAWNAPEAFELSKRLYHIDDMHAHEVDYHHVIDRIFMMSPNPAHDAFTKSEKDEELREIVLAFKTISKSVLSTKEARQKDMLQYLSERGITHDSILDTFADIAIKHALVESKENVQAGISEQDLQTTILEQLPVRVKAAKKKKKKSRAR